MLGLEKHLADAPDIAHKDGDQIAAWARGAGYTYRLITHPFDADGFSFRVEGVHMGRHFAYFGNGATATDAVHDGAAYLRDVGFMGSLSEKCDGWGCPHCQNIPFPTDFPKGDA